MERKLKKIVISDLFDSILQFGILFFLTWILLKLLMAFDATSVFLLNNFKATGDILVGCSILYFVFFFHDFYSKIDQKIFKEFNKLLKSIKKDEYLDSYSSYEFKEISQTLEDKKEELKNKDQALVESISYISHDMKTPITIINTNISLIQNSKDQFSEKNKIRLDRIYGENEKISNYIGELLKVVRTQTQDEENQKISVKEFVESIEKNIALYSDMLEEEIIVAKEISQAGKKLYINLSTINDCLIHLLNNAYEHRKEQMKVEILEKEETIELSVIDDGDGFDESKIENNKKLFYTNNTGRTQGKGYGIGLYFVNCYMENIKGKLKLFNDEKGTVAKMILPLESDENE